MSPKGEEKLRTLYAYLMDEVKVRIDCLDRAVRGQTGFPTPIVREFCYGQLRLLCELIGLSCLVAHGDIPATYAKQLGKQWSADTILKELEKIREHFYPQSINRTTSPINSRQKHHHLEAKPSQPFPKESLLSLYADTHKYIHRGNVRKILNSDTPIDLKPNFDQIIGWAQKINDHLDNHIIVISEERFMICVLRNADDGNRVQVVGADKQYHPSQPNATVPKLNLGDI
jgi:hypothetical protein